MYRIRRLLAPLLVVTMVVACDPSPPTSPPSGEPSPPTSSAATPGPSGSADPSVPAASVAWEPRSASGDTPAPRFGHTWVADPSDAAAYLFGGSGANGPLDDLWRYDFGADSWERRASDGPGPEPRSGHAAVLVDGVGLVVLGGTAADGGVLDDAWVYDPLADTWDALAVTGDRPPARTNTCAAVGPDGRIWIVYGLGRGGTALLDVWALDPAGGVWSRIQPDGTEPGARGAHGCWWTVDGRLVVHGGRSDATVFGDTWAIDDVVAGADGGTWSSVDPGDPGIPRSDFGSTLASDTIVIVAGQGSDRLARADVVALEPDSLVPASYVATGEAPLPRIGPAIVDDPGNERGLLFGGAVDGVPTDELWTFDLR